MYTGYVCHPGRVKTKTSSPEETNDKIAAKIASFAPTVIIISVSGLAFMPFSFFNFAAIASRNSKRPLEL